MEASSEEEEVVEYTTTKSGRRSIVRHSTGGSAAGGADYLANSTWRHREVAQLMDLVEKDGAGDWEAKAEALGTGRTSNSVEGKYYYEKREAAARDKKKVKKNAYVYTSSLRLRVVFRSALTDCL